MALNRRSFLRKTAAAAALSLPFAFGRRSASAGPAGGLVDDPTGILDLPAGFSYTVVQEHFVDMTDGYRVPGRPDGMACFAGAGGTYVLMRNHELSNGDFGNGPYKLGQLAPKEAYNPTATGGVTRVVVDANTLQPVSSNLVLVGTVRNCAGGPSPWGWLSCEENTATNHGYVFLCPADADAVSMPQKITGYGRYNHEAVAIDPATNIAYLTEDRGDSCLYRFVPDQMAVPFVGKLQALKVTGENNLDTSEDHADGTTWSIEWVDVDEPDPSGDTVRYEAQGKGAAIISRGEGIWYADGVVYICSTNGGPSGNGQIFALDVAAQTLEVLAQSTSSSILDNPDNICVAPWGEVFMAEDGGGTQYIRVLDEAGNITDFARNALSDSEMAGVCFSPDGRVLFVNIQKDGLTLAITGDFPEVKPPPDDPPPDDPPPDDPPPDDPPPDDPPPSDPPPDDDSPADDPGGDEPGGCTAVDSAGLSIGTLILVGAAVGAAAYSSSKPGTEAGSSRRR